jgi:hypothetical protein
MTRFIYYTLLNINRVNYIYHIKKFTIRGPWPLLPLLWFRPEQLVFSAAAAAMPLTKSPYKQPAAAVSTSSRPSWMILDAVACREGTSNKNIVVVVFTSATIAKLFILGTPRDGWDQRWVKGLNG